MRLQLAFSFGLECASGLVCSRILIQHAECLEAGFLWVLSHSLVSLPCSLELCCFFVGASVRLVSGRFQLGGAEAFIVLRFGEWGSRVVFGMAQAASKIIIGFRMHLFDLLFRTGLLFVKPPPKKKSDAAAKTQCPKHKEIYRCGRMFQPRRPPTPPSSRYHTVIRDVRIYRFQNARNTTCLS
jgi:hypothetical protein